MEGFSDRLRKVTERIENACAAVGRSASDVRMVTVSKTHGPDAVREAAECGVRVFGENKVQEADQKIAMCPGDLSWHMIGHLQTNKVKRAVMLFEMIHSVDSIKLLNTIDAACDKSGRFMPVMLEVNVSGEPSKFGLSPEDVEAVLESANELSRVDVVGLMTMPPFREDAEEVRPWFAALRELRDSLRPRTGYELPELSMGMSHDFETAIQEGATWIRLGTVLFGTRRSK